jgi:hypothetical protein
MLPAALIPPAPALWTNNGASFGVTRLRPTAPAATLRQALAQAAASLGTVTATTTTSICGAPAAVAEIAPDATTKMTEQIQTIDDATYGLVYDRQAALPPDPQIVALMASFCGAKSLEHMTLPDGWHTRTVNTLGVWVSPRQQMISALTISPPPTAAEMLQTTVGSSAKTPALVLESLTSGTLCGSPAQFLSARVTLLGRAPASVRVEVVSNGTLAYGMTFSFPVDAEPDPAALASLKTLCAPTAAPAPAKTP